MSRRETYRSHLAEVSRAAGLKRVVRPKDLRDTFASQLLTAGVTLAWISKRLGHQTVVVTAKHYATWAEADYRAPLVLAEGEVPPDLLARIDGTANAAGT